MKTPCSMVIQWSDEDDASIVTLPEFHNSMTHGDTCEEAARMGLEAIESLIECYEDQKLPLPPPFKFVFPQSSRSVPRPPQPSASP